VIEIADESDEECFVELYELSYKGLEEYAYRRRREIRSYFRWLKKRDEEGIFKFIINGEIVAFLACDSNWVSYFDSKEVGEIHELFVHPDYRRRGIARKLVKRAFEYFRDRRLDLCELWVGEKNDIAKKFYASIGFRELGTWGKWVRMIREI